MTTQHGRGEPRTAAASKKMTAFESQVARDWGRFKEKYFACAEYPAVRQALKKILAAEEKQMADIVARASSPHHTSSCERKAGKHG
jgi:hypothetical protein